MTAHPTPSVHRLRPGLPGYLIPFATLAFAPQRQDMPRKPPSPPVFLLISTHFTATPGIPLPHTYLQSDSIRSNTRLSLAVSHLTYPTAYARFTPSKFGQRSPPTYYRGCWHVVSRGLFTKYSQISSFAKDIYIPKDFICHATSLRQGFPHCARFLIAAPRRSLGRISVPIRLTILSDQLPVVALVSRYLTN